MKSLLQPAGYNHSARKRYAFTFGTSRQRPSRLSSLLHFVEKQQKKGGVSSCSTYSMTIINATCCLLLLILQTMSSLLTCFVSDQIVERRILGHHGVLNWQGYLNISLDILLKDKLSSLTLICEQDDMMFFKISTCADLSSFVTLSNTSQILMLGVGITVPEEAQGWSENQERAFC